MDSAAYSWLDRSLHALALNRMVAECSFDLEQALTKPSADAVYHGRHVFIACLARAGSTALLEALYATGRFRALTYSDMPFVLMPGMWRKLSAQGRRTNAPVERAHGDGIAITAESPEAFEQVFWRVFAGNAYIKPDRLVPHEAEDETLDKFRLFVAAALASGNSHGGLYLSKNNNNVLRLPSIRRAFPNCIIVVPYRDPVQHALSLLNQHRRFVRLHKEDRFSCRYMSWLAHHEFGITHKPFVFDPSEVALLKALERDSIDYWLAIWTHTYAHVLDRAPADTVWVKFEEFCLEPSRTLAGILERVGQTGVDLPLNKSFAPASRPVPKDARADVLEAAGRILERIDAKASAGRRNPGVGAGTRA